MTGNAEITRVFATDFEPAQIEREDLWRGTKAAQAKVSARVPLHMRGGDVETDGEVVSIAARVWEWGKERPVR